MVWSVGGIQASPAVSFVVGQLGDGTLISTELATNSTGQILGVSSVSIANGVVTTYSATEFDYQTSLYYDAGAVATMYEDGTPVRSASDSGGPRCRWELVFSRNIVEGLHVGHRSLRDCLHSERRFLLQSLLFSVGFLRRLQYRLYVCTGRWISLRINSADLFRQYGNGAYKRGYRWK